VKQVRTLATQAARRLRDREERPRVSAGSGVADEDALQQRRRLGAAVGPPGDRREPDERGERVGAGEAVAERALGRRQLPGRRQDLLPAIGSTKRAAISPSKRPNSSSRAARSLYGATRVSAVTASGTPGDDG
jgi:hypothetical protein